jgi:sporulation protein YunB
MCIVNFTVVSNNLTPTILKIAEVQTKKIATLIINKAVSRYILEHLDQTTMMNIEKNDKGLVTSITYNTLQLNQLLTKTTDIIQSNIKMVEKGEIDKLKYSDFGIDISSTLLKRGIIYEIPFGMAVNNVVLSSVGPKIPVRFQLVGDVVSNVISKVQEYGINNVLIELVISITVSQQVVIPLASSMTQVTNEIPISIKVIQGEIPDFYLGSRTVTGDSVSFIFEDSEAI